MDKTNDFIDCLFYHYLKNDVSYLEKAKTLADSTPFKGWPDDKKIFWEAESFVWRLKIDPKLKDMIRDKVGILKNNLDLGSGSDPYFEKTICQYK